MRPFSNAIAYIEQKIATLNDDSFCRAATMTNYILRFTLTTETKRAAEENEKKNYTHTHTQLRV